MDERDTQLDNVSNWNCELAIIESQLHRKDEELKRERERVKDTRENANHFDGEPSERLHEECVDLVDQIVALSCEAWVRFLVNHKHNVSRDDIRSLIAFSFKANLGSLLPTLANVNFQNLFLGPCGSSISIENL